MSWRDPSNPAAWSEYMEMKDREYMDAIRDKECVSCIHCRMPIDDGFKDVGCIGYCDRMQQFIDPMELVEDIGCEEWEG